LWEEEKPYIISRWVQLKSYTGDGWMDGLVKDEWEMFVNLYRAAFLRMAKLPNDTLTHKINLFLWENIEKRE